MLFVDVPAPDVTGEPFMQLQPFGNAAILRCDSSVLRVSLETGEIDWARERQPVWRGPLPRRVGVCPFTDASLWLDKSHTTLAELRRTDDGGLVVVARHFETGDVIWERSIGIPEALDWEVECSTPRSLEMSAFLADEQDFLIVAIVRRPKSGDEHSHLNVLQLDASTGSVQYLVDIPDAYVDILTRRKFQGVWSHGGHLGRVHWETGASEIIMERDEPLSQPIVNSSSVYVAWHGKKTATAVRMTHEGELLWQGKVDEPRIRSTRPWITGDGFGLQVNDQKLFWFGHADEAEWKALCKPYIYNVFCEAKSDVFVGTDGRGGNLYAFDTATGEQSRNFKQPVTGGFAEMAILPLHGVVAAPSALPDKTPVLLTIGLQGNRMFTVPIPKRKKKDHLAFLGFWDHGAVYQIGVDQPQLVIIDLRKDPGQST